MTRESFCSNFSFNIFLSYTTYGQTLDLNGFTSLLLLSTFGLGEQVRAGQSDGLILNVLENQRYIYSKKEVEYR